MIEFQYQKYLNISFFLFCLSFFSGFIPNYAFFIQEDITPYCFEVLQAWMG